MGRVKEISQAVKRYDSCLYAQETKPGRVDIYRRSKFGCLPPNFLFALTDTWTAQGKPVDYGIEVVLNRVKAMDLWRDDSFVERWIEENEGIEKARERDFHNSVESFFYDFRSEFKKSTDQVNTSNLKKLYRKESKYGAFESR